MVKVRGPKRPRLVRAGYVFRTQKGDEMTAGIDPSEFVLLWNSYDASNDDGRYVLCHPTAHSPGERIWFRPARDNKGLVIWRETRLPE